MAIGKKDPHTGMLIPNKKYCELFSVTQPESSSLRLDTVNLLPHKIADYGNTFVLMRIAKEIGLAQILTRQ
ncbi:hypothetical protein FACS1894187_23340 [Synergistales bacterium]|nr:hypothetical protein FACS1894187_23340 [Synergistales bacterium]